MTQYQNLEGNIVHSDSMTSSHIHYYIHRHVSQEVKSVSQVLQDGNGGIVLRSGLEIQGSAITPEKKPRVPTMSEKDLTRSHTAQTSTKERNMKNFEPVQKSVATRSNTSTLTKAAV